MKTLLDAIARKHTSHTPVWMMRQAGRYLPEYREVRAKAGGFMKMCQNPEIACEISLQPLKRFPLDAVIIFSDILTVPDAMGMGLHFIEGEGPSFAKQINSESDIAALPSIKAESDLDYVGNALSLVKSQLPEDVTLIGFAGSPWTTATYMIEGSSPKGAFIQSKAMLYNQPELLEALLSKLIDATVDYLLMQIRAGAEVIQLFDTWGGILPEASYVRFSLDPMRSIISRVKQVSPHTPITIFTKGGGQWLRTIGNSGCDCIGLDWTCNLNHARNQIGHKCSLQGNLDPAILRCTPEIIEQHTKSMLASFGNHPGHIANLGHGITPDIPPENVQAFVQTVHQHSGKS